MDASTSSSSAQEGETQDRLTAEFCVRVDFKTVKLNNSLVQGWRNGKSCCPFCVDIETIKLLKLPELEKLQLYVFPDGLKQHIKHLHQKKRWNSDVEEKAKKVSRYATAQESRENILSLSSERNCKDPDGKLYKKVRVETSCSEYTHDLFAKSEKEACKLICLPLFYRGIIKQIQDRDDGYDVTVKSDTKELIIRVWKAPQKFYLETVSCKLVSF